MKRISPTFALLLGLLTAAAQPAGASHAWGTYHWARTGSSVELSVMDSVTSDWDGRLARAVGEWDASDVLTLRIESGPTDARTRRKCAPIRGKIRACNLAYGYNGWLGVAQIWLSGGHIVQATTKVNDSYFALASYNNEDAKQHVICQELGHDFGLDHQYTQPSCMDDTNGLSDPAYASPASHDFEQLATIYAHTEAQTQTADGPGKNRARGRSTVERGRDGRYELVTVTLWA